MGLVITSQPAVEVWTVADSEVKNHFHVDTSDEDSSIGLYLQAARRRVERETNQALITQTWRRTLDNFSSREIVLGRNPVQSVSSFGYIDSAGVIQVVDSAMYEVDLASMPAKVVLAYAQVWPFITPRTGGVTITFVAGYGAAGTSVPAELRLAILQLAAMAYRHREAVSELNLMPIPMGIKDLLSLYWDGTYSDAAEVHRGMATRWDGTAY